MLPLAVQYGMPLNEFWYGDVRLLGVYQKAYMRDKSYTAWLNGAYIFEANSKAIANGNRVKRSDPVQNYENWKDPIPKPKMAKERIEEKFRKSQANQNLWLHNMINK